MMQLSDAFLLGLDYQLGSWRAFDHKLLEETLDWMAGRGLRLLRLPVTWGDFQPDPRRLSDRRLRDLEAAMNTAAAYRVSLIPVLFSPGVAGSSNPAWVAPGGEYALEGQLHLLEVLVSYFRGHRAILTWELDAAGARDLNLIGEWHDFLLPAARLVDSVHPLALGLSGDSLLRGERPLLNLLARSVDLVLLDWFGPCSLAALACAVVWRLTGKRTLASLRQAPSGGQEMEDALLALHGAGALGALLPDLGGGSRTSAESWETLEKAAGEGWRVEAGPPAIALEPGDFYDAPLANWQALIRDWPG